MKKTVVAGAVVSTLMSSLVGAAEVYSKDGTSLDVGGRMEFRGDFGGKDNGQTIDGSMENKSRARLSIKGQTKINDSLTGFGKYEVEHAVVSSGGKDDGSDANKFKQRYMFAGLDTQFGAVSLGKQDTAGVIISQMSDNGQIYTGIQKEFINAGNEQVNNVVKYSADFMDALTVEASAILGSGKNTDGAGVAAKYRLPFGLALGLGYAQNGNGQNNGIDEGNAKQTIAGLSYAIGGLELGGTYTQGELDDKNGKDFKGAELSAAYKIGNGFSVLAAYQNTEKDSTDASSGKEKTNFYELTGQYKFNSNLRTYLAFKLNNLKKGESAKLKDVDAENSVRLGLRYDF
ncbi:porin [Vibrio methylphosphonaticus]|uniref:porin n=1 Tax=Vibrio methylphosphonaticus TaxID=2946866 RepID=UPI002029C74B|nr:porin [Vibrio methylphosphonaticus]MCL9773837.1 porin [Vibrio methylphosphonaticus]